MWYPSLHIGMYLAFIVTIIKSGTGLDLTVIYPLAGEIREELVPTFTKNLNAS